MSRSSKKILIIFLTILLVFIVAINTWINSQDLESPSEHEAPIQDITMTLFEQKQTSSIMPNASMHQPAITITRRPSKETKTQAVNEATEEIHHKKRSSTAQKTSHSKTRENSDFIPEPGITKNNNRPAEEEVKKMIQSGIIIW